MDLSFRKIAPGTYQKWNPVLGVRTTLKFDGDAIHVRHDQPRWVIDAVLDRNVAMQNGFRGYKGALVTQTASLPIAIHAQVMKQCGFQPGHGYDEKKFHQILNDRDNYKLKTVSGSL